MAAGVVDQIPSGEQAIPTQDAEECPQQSKSEEALDITMTDPVTTYQLERPCALTGPPSPQDSIVSDAVCGRAWKSGGDVWEPRRPSYSASDAFLAAQMQHEPLPGPLTKAERAREAARKRRAELDSSGSRRR